VPLKCVSPAALACTLSDAYSRGVSAAHTNAAALHTAADSTGTHATHPAAVPQAPLQRDNGSDGGFDAVTAAVSDSDEEEGGAAAAESEAPM